MQTLGSFLAGLGSVFIYPDRWFVPFSSTEAKGFPKPLGCDSKQS